MTQQPPEGGTPESKRRPTGSFPRQEPDGQGTDPARKRASGSFPVTPEQSAAATDPARKRPSGAFPPLEGGAPATDPARKRPPTASFPPLEAGAPVTDPARRRPSGSFPPLEGAGPATDPARKRPTGSFPLPADPGAVIPGTDPAKRRPSGVFPAEAGTGNTDPAKRRPSGQFPRPEGDGPAPGTDPAKRRPSGSFARGEVEADAPKRGARRPSGSYSRPDAPGGPDATDPARRRPTGGFPRAASSGSHPAVRDEALLARGEVPPPPSAVTPARATGRHRTGAYASAPIGPREQQEDALLGRTLGGCTLEKLIGRGGMATVYQARQQDLDREVAVKVLSQRLTQDPRQIEQFAREAKTLAKLEHPNIVTVYSFGREEDGPCWLVVQLIRGGSLRSLLLEKKRIEPQVATGYIMQVARGLHEAHKAGIIHRDIKPDNVLVASGPTLKITDFGLARMAGDHAQQFGAGEVVGTPHYMSPEQVDAVPDIDARTDIYALGATFYHLLVGETPYTAPSTLELLLKHVNEPLIPPHERQKDVPVELSRIVMRMMAKDRAERYQNLEEVLRDLESPAKAGVASGSKKAAEAAAPSLLLVDDLPALRPEPLKAERPRALSYAAVGLITAAALALGLGIGPLHAVLAAPAEEVVDPREAAAAQAQARLERELAAATTPEQRLELLQRFAEERAGTQAGAAASAEAAKLQDQLAKERAELARLKLAEVEGLLAEGRPGPALDALAATPAPVMKLAGDAAQALRKRIEEDLAARGVAWMPLGPFSMGEGTRARQTVVAAVYVDLREVTCAQYAEFVKASGEPSPPSWGGPAPSAERAPLPVTGVSLREAMAYAAWRKGRLPRAAEWEKAARGQDALRWPWGGEPDPQACNWRGAGLGRAAPPGAFPRDRSPLGCLDMAGNVAELTLAPVSTDAAPSAWVRGGSFVTLALACTRGAFYQELGPDERHDAVGFRCVYDSPPGGGQ